MQPPLYIFDSSNTQLVVPDSGHLLYGFAPLEKPPVQYHNWLFQNPSLWSTWLLSKAYTDQPLTLESSSPVVWNGSNTVTPGAYISIFFRGQTSLFCENRLPAATYTIANDDVLVVYPNGSTASPVVLTLGTYGSLTAGQYAIVASSALSPAQDQNEMILFRVNGANLEIPTAGQVIYGSMSFNISGLPSDLVYADKTETITGSWTWAANLNMNGYEITSLHNPGYSDTLAANQNFVETYVDSFFPLTIANGGTNQTSNGINGQVLTSDGLGSTDWSTPATGTVTSITAGTGLIGGTITTSGTIALANNGPFLEQIGTSAFSPDSYMLGPIDMGTQNLDNINNMNVIGEAEFEGSALMNYSTVDPPAFDGSFNPIGMLKAYVVFQVATVGNPSTVTILSSYNVTSVTPIDYISPGSNQFQINFNSNFLAAQNVLPIASCYQRSQEITNKGGSPLPGGTLSYSTYISSDTSTGSIKVNAFDTDANNQFGVGLTFTVLVFGTLA